jgi:hypothetical protein
MALLIHDSTYGSDETGLVCGYAFEPGCPGTALEPGSAPELVPVVGAQAPPSRFLWLHFNVSNAAAAPWLKQHTSLPEAVYESLHESTASTRVDQSESSLLAVVNDVLFDFDYDAAHASSVSLCVQAALLVSARTKPLRSIDRFDVAEVEVQGVDRDLDLPEGQREPSRRPCPARARRGLGRRACRPRRLPAGRRDERSLKRPPRTTSPLAHDRSTRFV